MSRNDPGYDAYMAERAAAEEYEYRMAESAAAEAEAVAAQQEYEQRQAAVDKVLEGFEVGVFVRDVSRDHEPGWALRVAPYLVALAQLVPAESDEARPGGGDGNQPRD